MSDRIDWKIKKIKQITGRIRVVTGLHIGGSTETMEIGGVDNPIIRNPANSEPYIPGSSLKGKMRSSMEWHLGMLDKDGGPYRSEDPKCPITRVFGTMDGAVKIGPTRLVVRDCQLAADSREKLVAGDPITEIKYENSINRITAMANPRPLERVVPGVIFDLDIVYRVLDTGDDGELDEKYFREVVLTALSLLQQDCLGGSGSRGCGKIEFLELKDEEGKELALPKVLEATA